MAHRYRVAIIGYVVADDTDEVTTILEDVAGAGVNIERATADGQELWFNLRAEFAGRADD